MRLIIIFLLLWDTSNTVINAQQIQNKIYQSVVLNETDSSALSYVHVHIEELSIGVVTNSLGEFQNNFDDSLANKNLVFSCIGFKKLKLPFNEVLLNKTKYDSVFLIPDTFMLKEVIVVASQLDTLDIFIKKVIDKIKVNYPTDDYYLSGFYRQISQNGDSSSRIIEAAISIQDPSYSGKEDKLRIKVNQIRKSDDYIQYSWTKSLIPLVIGTENDLIKTYQTDFLRQGGKLIKGGTVLTYELKLDSIFGTGDNQVAKIVFHSNENINAPYFIGEIFVSLSDLAINRMSYSWIAHPKFHFYNQDLIFYNGKYRFKKMIEYHKIGSKYYPFFISSFESIAGVTGAKGKLQFKESIILINEVLLKKSEYSKIKKREREAEDEDIYEKKLPYDARFWNGYNIVIVNPIREKQRFALEKGESLENQFQKNGKRR